MLQSNRKHWFPSPYNPKETIGVLWRNAFGPNQRNPCNIHFIPHETTLNNIDPKIKLGFIGDIMDLNHKTLAYHSNITDFLHDCHFLIGNFEAILTHHRRKWIMDQVHDELILESLKKLYSPEKTYLSVANNHAGDFKPSIFHESNKIIEDAGFHIFGKSANPYIDLIPEIRIATATNWSNKTCFEIPYLEEIDRSWIKQDAFNVIFPHWGYELETYPRPSTVEQANVLLNSFDAIIGHHSHVPQPITLINRNISGSITNHLVAYSLGDFCFGKPFSMFYYGIIIKIELGPLLSKNDNRKWGIGKIHWEFIESKVRKDKKPNDVFIEIKNNNPFFSITQYIS